MDINKTVDNQSATLAALIPVWNRPRLLQVTLDSIAEQAVHCEIFVVDDGSEPVVELPGNIGDKPIHLIRHTRNQGITEALNTGLRAILKRPFEFISRHDCGDLDRSDRLSSQLAFLQQYQNVMLVGSSVNFEAADGKLQFVFHAPQNQQQISRKMCYSAAIMHPTCMFRATAFKESGLYSDAYPHAEDYELFFRLQSKYEIRNLPDALVNASYNADGITISQRRDTLISRLKLQLKYFNAFTIHSYLGITQTLVLTVLPYRIVRQIKSLRSTLKGDRLY